VSVQLAVQIGKILLLSVHMASTYLRPDSPFIWIRAKDASGKWKNFKTEYRQDNPKDRKQAKLVAQEKSFLEATTRVQQPAQSTFDQWVPAWIDLRWGKGSPLTLRKYLGWWDNLSKYLARSGANHPAAVTREIVLNYIAEREASGAGRNSVLGEVSFLGQVLGEAIKRDYCRTNVARNLGLHRIEQVHKTPWTAEQIEMAIAAAEPFSWIESVLLLGKYQASRLGQAEVPLSAIDLSRQVIAWPASVMKQRKAFVQSIDPAFIPALKRIVEHRRASGETTLATLPKDPSPSLHLRRFLDGIGLHGLSVHGLRVSWVSRAALSGVPLAVTMQFCNHADKLVHQVYTQLAAGDVNQFFDRLK
jgi:integrase